MFNRLIKYLDKFDMLSHSQFGFRANHATYNATLALTDEIKKVLNKNKYTTGIFDTIDHNILAYYINKNTME